MKRRAVSLLALCCLMGVVAGSAQGVTDLNRPKIIGTVKFCFNPQNVAQLPQFYAVRARIMQKHGLGVQFVSAPSGPACVQLLATGQADFSVGLFTDAILSNRRGTDLRVVTGNFDRNLFQLACRRSVGISGSYPAVMSRLKGKTVGVASVAGANAQALIFTLRRVGIDPADVKIVPLGAAPNYLAALTAGVVDCATLYAPMQYNSEITSLVTKILDWGKGQGPAEFGNYPANSTLVSQAWASKNPEKVRRWQAAMVDALNVIRNPVNRDRVASVVTPDYPGLTPAQMRAFAGDVRVAISTERTAKTMTQAQFNNAVKIYNVFNPGVALGVTLREILVSLPPR